MRYLIAVDGWRNFDTVFMDIDEKMLEAHPEMVFKMGEIMGEFIKNGGELHERTDGPTEETE